MFSITLAQQAAHAVETAQMLGAPGALTAAARSFALQALPAVDHHGGAITAGPALSRWEILGRVSLLLATLGTPVGVGLVLRFLHRRGAQPPVQVRLPSSVDVGATAAVLRAVRSTPGPSATALDRLRATTTPAGRQLAAVIALFELPLNTWSAIEGRPGELAEDPAAALANGVPVTVEGRPEQLFPLLMDVCRAGTNAPSTRRLTLASLNEELTWYPSPRGGHYGEWKVRMPDGRPSFIAVASGVSTMGATDRRPRGNEINPDGYAFRFGAGWCLVTPYLHTDGELCGLEVRLLKRSPLRPDFTRAPLPAGAAVEGLYGASPANAWLRIDLNCLAQA